MSIAWGTIAYGIAAGVCAATALVFFLIGARRRHPDPLMVSFGLFAVVSACNAIVTVRLHLSTSIEDYAAVFKVFGLANLGDVVAIVILTAAWTRSLPRPALIGFGAATLIIAALQVGLPKGLLVGDIEGLRNVELFGEQFVVHVGTGSPWGLVLALYLICAATMVLVALIRSVRRGGDERFHSWIILIAVVVASSISFYDSFVDSGQVDTVYLTPFGLLLVVLAGAGYLAERTVQTDERLRKQTVRLEETVAERTTALTESNRQLAQRLVREQQSTADLASLAAEFEASNALVDPDSDSVTMSLYRLLEQLGVILSATAVELHLDEPGSTAVVPRRLAWHRRDTFDDVAPYESTATSFDVTAPISIGAREIGRLVARGTTEPDVIGGEYNYVELTAEHLAGLIDRIGLVEQIAETAVQSERDRIAMDLHDSVTQRMYSISFLADAAVHLADDDPASVSDPVNRIRELVLLSLAELRTLLFELRPEAFETESLAHLLSQLADGMRSTSEPRILEHAEPVPPMPGEIKTTIYRIAQEALSNACRHSRASEVSVELGHADGVTRLVVSDDGDGFVPSRTSEGNGLGNLRARAARIHAELDISSTPECGTTIELRWTPPTESAASVEQVHSA